MTHHPLPPIRLQLLFASITLAFALLLGCSTGQTSPAEPDPATATTHSSSSSSSSSAGASTDEPAASFNLKRYNARLRRLEATRARLARRYQAASSAQDRARVLNQARSAVRRGVLDTIFPAWMGSPWGLGSNSTATRPHQPNMTVGCSYFVTSVLQNAGLKLSDRYAFAQAPALHIQRSLAPRAADLHRFLSIPPRDLEARLQRLPPGLYLIGLINHVGFVVVGDQGKVRFVHSAATGDQVVIDEPLSSSEAVAISQPAGYFVTPLFQDDRLILHWLLGKPVPFQKLGV